MTVNDIGKDGVIGTPAFEAKEEKGGVMVPPSGAGGGMTIGKDGEISTSKEYAGREGKVLNPGVRKVSVGALGPACPKCKRTGTLKMRMNRKAGERTYCSAGDCDYDQSSSQVHREGGIKPSPNTKIMDTRGRQEERGVTIIRGRSG